MFLLSLTHVLFFAPPLFYIAATRSQTPLWAFKALLFAGMFILAFHLYRMIGGGSYINLIHIFIVAPLLITIGWKAKHTPRMLYELLIMVTFGMLGWHMLNMVRLLNLHSEIVDHMTEL